MGHDDLLSRFDITFAPDPSRKESLVKASATILTLVAAMGCGGGGQTSHTVLVAPRLNLLPYGSVGLVTFSIEKAKGTLNEFATRRFEEYLLAAQDRKSTRLNSSHPSISYAVFCLKKKNKEHRTLVPAHGQR